MAWDVGKTVHGQDGHCEHLVSGGVGSQVEPDMVVITTIAVLGGIGPFVIGSIALR